ncbi:hypothetical protein [Marasmitruncus massiliensis]|uniref:hypothetical protein n=1 Tax=Marasmitruncus massiliensis TaxID=1944642 RepID=UPI000C7DA0DD|nr:hypothetical protein [Marasmitruncus massiliensis]
MIDTSYLLRKFLTFPLGEYICQPLLCQRNSGRHMRVGVAVFQRARRGNQTNKCAVRRAHQTLSAAEKTEDYSVQKHFHPARRAIIQLTAQKPIDWPEKSRS